MRVFKHVLVVLLALFVTLGVPCLYYADVGAILGGSTVDAVARATVELPDTPSGHFVVYMNRDRHRDSLEQWRAFFDEEDYGVLLEDVGCMVISGDVTGRQLAERYQARLVKDQMTIRTENGVLVASRLDSGRYDMVIVSREMAGAWALAPPANAETVVIQGDTP